MTSPFNHLAPVYDETWTRSAIGRSQRDQVWRVLDCVFRPGDRILDVGCGTGEDALRYGAIGIDASPEMVRIACARGVDARVLRIEDLASFRAAPVRKRNEDLFDGVISNFGALNCIADLSPVAHELAHLVRPGGAVAICIMPRFCWSETFRYLLRARPDKAFRRWTGHANWRGIDVYYPTTRQLRTAFRNFDLESRTPIGRGDHQLYIFRRPC